MSSPLLSRAPEQGTPRKHLPLPSCPQPARLRTRVGDAPVVQGGLHIRSAPALHSAETWGVGWASRGHTLNRGVPG